MLNWHGAEQAILESPYLGLLLTLISFQLGLSVFRRANQHPLLHPVLVSVLSLIAVLLLLGIQFEQYYVSAKLLSDLLGIVIVALAVPMYENLKSLWRFGLPVLVSNVLGGAVAIGVAVWLCQLLNLDSQTIGSMWTKSITTAFALELAPSIGGLAAVAAAIVMVTGIVGAIIGPWLFRIFRVTHPAAQGTALGVCAHAIGISRALELGKEQGAFAALSMSLTGILCAFALPWLLA